MTLFDNSSHESTIAPHCPWYEAQQSFGTPNVNWCEPTQCAYINEPANTWSNLSLLVFGLIIIKSFKHTQLRLFGLIVILMGFLSAIYHASNNFLTQELDFIGMVMMTSFILVFEVQRLFPKRGPNFFTLYWFFVALNIFAIVLLTTSNIAIQSIIFINAVPAFIIDLFCGFREKAFKKYFYFFAAIFVLILAQTLTQIDLKRIYCDPNAVFLHGHVLWHIFSALAMLILAKHMQIHNRFKT